MAERPTRGVNTTCNPHQRTNFFYQPSDHGRTRWITSRCQRDHQEEAIREIETERVEKGEHSHSRHGRLQELEVVWEERQWAEEERAMVYMQRLESLVSTRTNGDLDRPRFSEREQLPLPDKPPYTAHLGNLTYDVTGADVESFFGECQVTNVRIVEDKIDHKPKGFGYVEFATLDDLKKALTHSESNFMGRNVKISVAEPRTFSKMLKSLLKF